MKMNMTNHKFIDVIDVEELDYVEDVYDITVEDNHNFFANGMVVHNCVGGYPSGIIYGEFAEKKFAELDPSLVDDEIVRGRIRTKLENAVDRFVDCVGHENFFLELQFNKLPAQDLTNRMMIETAASTGCKLISTADSHYPEPALWEAREIYRQLQPGRMKIGVEPKPPPKFEELKCELYPKNAQQMWDEYLSRREVYSWYEGTEDVVRTSMENGHDIAWNLCEEIWFDTFAKLPSFNTPEKSSFKQLVELVKEGLKVEGLDKKSEYVSRAKMELDDIKYLKSEDYFMTLQKVFKLAENRTLPGSGRGCFIPGSRVLMSDGLQSPIEAVKIGDVVVDAYGNNQIVENTLTYDVDEELIELSFDDRRRITCTKDHEFLTKRGWVKAIELDDDDEVISFS
jgi:hypothetical protein